MILIINNYKVIFINCILLGIPDRPQIADANTTSSTATIVWLPVDYNGGYQRKFLSYSVQYTDDAKLRDNDCKQCLQSNNITKTTVTIENLFYNSSYWIRIISQNPAGDNYGSWMKISTKGNKPVIFIILVWKLLP